MMALPDWWYEREKMPDCGLTVAELNSLVEAALAERDRRDDVACRAGFNPHRVDDCGCMGPLPHCLCKRQGIARDIAAALAAMKKGGV